MSLTTWMASALRAYARRTGRASYLYRRFACESSVEWGEFLARWGGFYRCGRDVSINIGCTITDPYLVSIGNNVGLSACTLVGHDGTVRIMNNALGERFDSVGPITICDHVFIGHGAVVMPNLTIGPRAIIAAGSVVTSDVPPGSVVAGVPAKVVSTFDAVAERMRARTASYPWNDLIQQRDGAFDAKIEPILRRRRQAHFFGAASGTSAEDEPRA